MSRPLVTVYSADSGKPTGKQLPLPEVFNCPIRDDVVHQVFVNLNKNHRQAHGVSEMAGHQTSAESWGTGRAVARIPRVSGGGTHRAGQGAFGNMCRGGHMFAPNKTWRRWHRRVNVNLKRYAVASAVAATAVPALVLARGHKVAHLPEIPLVVSAESMLAISKTAKAAAALKKLGALGDVLRVKESRKIRAGKGKMRNRRYTQRKGPLVVYKEKGTIARAFRNIPGIELCGVQRLNLLKLAPGGHLGRFVIWTSDAFEELAKIYGKSAGSSSNLKKGFHLPRAKLTNASVNRVILSDEVQSVVRPRKVVKAAQRKVNPLRNFGTLVKLNPYAEVLRRRAVLNEQAIKKARDLVAAKKKAAAAGEPAAKKAKKAAPKKDAKGKPVEKKEKPRTSDKGGKKHKVPRGLFRAQIKKRQTTKARNARLVKARKAFASLLFA